MASNIHSALEEVPPDKERASRALRIAVVSGRAFSFPSALLNMWERIFEHEERFGAVEGLARGSVSETGFMLTVIGYMRGRLPQIIMNILNSKPWEVLEILALGDIKGVVDEDVFLVDRW